MSTIEEIKLKALAAVREICMGVEFAEQAHDAIASHAFRPESDSEIESSEASLFTARSLLDELEEGLAKLRREALA